MAFIGLRPLLVQYLPLYSEEQHHRHNVIVSVGYLYVKGCSILYVNLQINAALAG